MLKQVTDKLFSIGVHVTTVPKIHEKLVIIDETIFWEGSLNPLSYRDTSERMTRWKCSQKVRKVMVKHKLFKCSKCRENSMQGDILSVFGDIIRRRRKMLKMSQFEFSEISGIGQSEISRIERGEVDCRLSTIALLLSMLKMNCRPLLWHMVPSIEQELNVLLTRQNSAGELELEQGL